MADIPLDIILERRAERRGQERTVYRQTSPRASSIGDCAREIYHSIVDWEQRPAPDVELLYRFKRGSEVENIVVRELLDLGFDVIGAQIQFEIKDFVAEAGGDLVICTGHIDGKLRMPDGSTPVFDVKSLNPNVWNRINTAHDFIRMGSFWAKYPRQLLMYMYQYSEPRGFFLLDDCCGHWKVIEMKLLEWIDECEEALQIATAAAVGVATKTPPHYHPDPSVCRRCWARDAGVCHPPLNFSQDAMTLIEDEDFAADLERAQELKEKGDEFAALDRKIKERMKAHGNGNFVAGDFLLKVETRPRTTYSIPAEVKEKFKTSGTATHVKWQKVEGDE